MRPADEIDTLFKQNLNLSASPELDRRIDELFDQAAPQPALPSSAWRYIMQTRTIKYATAALLLVVALLWFTSENTITSPAYGLQDSIQAYSSIRWIQGKIFSYHGAERYDGEFWIECDDLGKPKRFRIHAHQISTGNEYGALTSVNDGCGTEFWFHKFNLCYRIPSDTYLGAIFVLGWDITETDPRLLCEQLFSRQDAGECQLTIDEPQEKHKPIVVTATSNQKTAAAYEKTVLYVDQATRLVKKLELFSSQSDNPDHLCTTIEFADYNQPIDPIMFSLQDELPEDVIWVDQTDKEIGLEQGDMTDEEVAIELTRQFVTALIAEDYDKAGLLWIGSPGFLLEEIFSGVKILELLSIDEARLDEDGAMVVSCKVLVESKFLQEKTELRINFSARPITTQPVRWTVGSISNTGPVQE